MIAGKGGFPDRERDEREVRNYYLAADKAEALATLKRPLKAEDLQTLHGLAFEESQSRLPTATAKTSSETAATPVLFTCRRRRGRFQRS